MYIHAEHEHDHHDPRHAWRQATQFNLPIAPDTAIKIVVIIVLSTCNRQIRYEDVPPATTNPSRRLSSPHTPENILERPRKHGEAFHGRREVDEYNNSLFLAGRG